MNKNVGALLEVPDLEMRLLVQRGIFSESSHYIDWDRLFCLWEEEG